MSRILACILLILTICASPQKGGAQINYVLNGSFEKIDSCPVTYNQIYCAGFWTGIDTPYTIYDTTIYAYGACIPELINSCSTDIGVSLPNNAYFSNRFAHTGSSMAQIAVHNNNSNTTWAFYQRNYLQGRLRKQLIAGKQYCVTFYTTIEQASAYAIDHIGAYLDDGSIDTIDRGRMALIHNWCHPQVYDSIISNDTINWTKVQGSFIAHGNERFITLANFFDIDHTDTVAVHYPSMYSATGIRIFSFYLIDDVSVIAIDAVAYAGRDTMITTAIADSAWIGTQSDYVPCRWYKITASGTVLIDSNMGGFMVRPDSTTRYIMELEVCGHVTRDTVTVFVVPVGISSLSLKLSGAINIYPNPATSEVTISGAANCEVVFYDMVGRAVQWSTVNGSRKLSGSTINIEGLSNGVYFVEVVDKVTGEKVVLRLLHDLQ